MDNFIFQNVLSNSKRIAVDKRRISWQLFHYHRREKLGCRLLLRRATGLASSGMPLLQGRASAANLSGGAVGGKREWWRIWERGWRLCAASVAWYTQNIGEIRLSGDGKWNKECMEKWHMRDFLWWWLNKRKWPIAEGIDVIEGHSEGERDSSNRAKWYFEV